jgi:distribution and morphology protein 34
MDLLGNSRGILAANQPLVVPMLLRLSHFKLNAVVVLVVSKQKGMTLVFKTDPLQNVDVNSTFDSIAVIQKYIQREIEGQLREMFREDLPGIIHRLSQRWFAAKSTVEAPYLRGPPPPGNLQRAESEPIATAESLAADYLHRFPAVGLRPALMEHPLRFPQYAASDRVFPTRRTAMSSMGVARRRVPTTAGSVATAPLAAPPPTEISDSSVPDIENFDPTYGMRPEGLPTKSGYSGFGRLWTANRGLGDLREEVEDDDDNGYEESFDIVDWDDMIPDGSALEPSYPGEDAPEYETIPAVGGGTVTRPRVYHSQSLIQPPPGVSMTPTASSTTTRYNRTARSELGATPSQSTHGNIRAYDRSSVSHQDLSRRPDTSDINSWRSSSQPSLLPRRPPSTHSHPVLPSRPFKHSSLAQTWTESEEPEQSYFPPVLGSRGEDEGPSFVYHAPSEASRSPNSFRHTSTESYPSRSSSGLPSLSTPPSSDMLPEEDPFASPGIPQYKAPRDRRRSLSPSVLHPFDPLHYGSSPPNIRHAMESDQGIVLQPGLSNTVTQLSTLSHSNHTLSPFTRSVEHFTVRSVPRRESRPTTKNTAPEKPPVKAKRKRIYNLGARKVTEVALLESLPPKEPTGFSPAPPSVVSEVDHYFASPSHRRASYSSASQY